ncbi:hypothetical protein FB45DRAFT_782868 [Roridomyces roridus]|uniref:Uncharacterized protein n=1 Tax=Roridomyces roridus TaxID=1738132 RepID=A0AAD7CGM0_9AGAR|nr:hypothetical protein FB45DRAFT_782868 [Roridomyces roridus]
MSHTSPATYLVWLIVSCILLSFMVFHLWSFDRFKCLRWNSGQNGAFKRVMTYSYLLSLPLITTYALGYTIIKYKEGFIALEDGTVVAKPFEMWPQSSRHAIFPLTLIFSIGWSMEMISHLEELCFWLFLVNSGSVQQNWFRSVYFRTWVVGSCVAVLYMPLLTIFTRDDPLKCEAYTFLGGSLGSLSVTLWFTPILWAFPAFLNSLKSEGVDIATIVRLTKFHEYNMIRIAFRFIFVVPLLILGADGITPHTHINESMLWTDFLTMISAFGVSVSSALTLVIFFPRSIEGEIAARESIKSQRQGRSGGGFGSQNLMQSQNRYSEYSASSHGGSPGNPYASASHRYSFPPPGNSPSAPPRAASPPTMHKEWTYDDEEQDELPSLPRLQPMRPNRRRGEDVEMGGITHLSETNLSQHNLHRNRSTLNPLVHNFKSPIDIMEERTPRLTFTKY